MGVEISLSPAAIKILRENKLPKSRLRQTAKKLLNALGCEHRELSLVLSDDRQLHELNKNYRGIDKATDVLSFALDEGEQAQYAGGMLGDVVISLETAKRQAAEYEVTFAAEMLRLLIHGVLHLLGYDHEGVPPAVARKMRRKEEELFALLEGNFR